MWRALHCPYKNMRKIAIQVRVDGRIKKKAEAALHDMGLSMSEIVRVLLVRVGEEKAIPFQIKVPNSRTIEAIEAVERGEVVTSGSVEQLMKDLNADDSVGNAVQARLSPRESKPASQKHRRLAAGHSCTSSRG
jgi:DNA-damage-inducible protein J